MDKNADQLDTSMHRKLALYFPLRFVIHLEHFSLAISVPPTGVFASCGQSWLSSRQ